MNVSCGPQPRWRPYMAQPVYERAPERFGPAGSLTWQGPRYNSLHQGVSASGTGFKTKRVDCLSPLNIDFDELRLMRVQKKPMGFRSAPFGGTDKPRMELYLGALPPDQASKRSHRPTSLQPTPLLRTDTVRTIFIYQSLFFKFLCPLVRLCIMQKIINTLARMMIYRAIEQIAKTNGD